MLRIRLRAPGALVAGLFAGPALLLAQGTATAAPAAWVWSGSYGTASSAGTWDYVDHPEPDRWDVVFDGELTNSGGECYSTWFAVTYDLSMPVYAKAGTQCGPGTAPVHYSLASYGVGWNTNAYVTVCKGTTTRDDCAPLRWISTIWA
ncbi:hypothetical protein [Streptomyces fumanus]|uniref:Secreted protein n=1 Tax=Streptomyces fumanus TaxID=67302 RepID=A0A919A348_9ACTN|nr:hypothetical protein [Streptomyces fumanus]GHE83465.1 hypothetical protein GCM10018772_02340 [Streptomyces fumanus]